MSGSPTTSARRVLIACDLFKGTASAVAACAALRDGWRSVRPRDEVRSLPFADGGEGTLDAVATAVPGSTMVLVPGVTGPDGRLVDARYLRLGDGTAVVELASASGLPLMQQLDPLGATSRGTGEVIATAVRHGAQRLVIGLGGSASSDGGAGLLSALGLSVLDDAGWAVPPGAAGLLRGVKVDSSGLIPPPKGGVLVLTDVENPLLGPDGAAAVFGPQKGAGPAEVDLIEAALENWAELIGADPGLPGAGAAGGTASGLEQVWGARLALGAEWLAETVGLDSAVAESSLVITGEGRFDATSLNGKAAGNVLRCAASVGGRAVVVAGTVGRDAPSGYRTVELRQLAGSAAAAMDHPLRWLRAAGRVLAEEFDG